MKKIENNFWNEVKKGLAQRSGVARLTPKEAQREFEMLPDKRISDAEIDSIIDRVTSGKLAIWTPMPNIALLTMIFTFLFTIVTSASTINLSFYEHGTNEAIINASPLDSITIDMVGVISDHTTNLASYEVDIIDNTAFNGTDKGLSVQLPDNRQVKPNGWLDLSSSVYPVELWNTPLDSDAFSTDFIYDLESGSHILEEIIITLPDVIPVGGYILTSNNAFFFDSFGDEINIGQIRECVIVPEPSIILFLIVPTVVIFSKKFGGLNNGKNSETSRCG